MTVNTNWEVDSYKSEFEPDSYWNLKKSFMVAHKNKYPEEKLVCLAQILCNVEFLGCRYPEKPMKIVEELSKDIAVSHRKKKKNKWQMTFVAASDADGTKIEDMKYKMDDFGNSNANRTSEDSVEDVISTEAGTSEQELSNSEDFHIPREIQSNEGLLSLKDLKETINQPKFNELLRTATDRKMPPNHDLNFENFARRNTKTLYAAIAASDAPIRKKFADSPFLMWKLLQYHYSLELAKTSSQDFQLRKEDVFKKDVRKYASKDQKLGEDNVGMKTMGWTGDGLHKNAQRIEVQEKDVPKAASIDQELGEDNVGRRMMKMMGWTGGGLGKNSQGIEKPVETSGVLNRSGLGFRSVFHPKNIFFRNPERIMKIPKMRSKDIAAKRQRGKKNKKIEEKNMRKASVSASDAAGNRIEDLEWKVVDTWNSNDNEKSEASEKDEIPPDESISEKKGLEWKVVDTWNSNANEKSEASEKDEIPPDESISWIHESMEWKVVDTWNSNADEKSEVSKKDEISPDESISEKERSNFSDIQILTEMKSTEGPCSPIYLMVTENQTAMNNLRKTASAWKKPCNFYLKQNNGIWSCTSHWSNITAVIETRLKLIAKLAASEFLMWKLQQHYYTLQLTRFSKKDIEMRQSDAQTNVVSKVVAKDQELGEDDRAEEIEKPMETSRVVTRSEVGFENNSANPKMIDSFLMEFKTSRDSSSELVFSDDFTNKERKLVHEAARRAGLQSKSIDSGNNRQLFVSKLVYKRKTDPWKFIETLFTTKGTLLDGCEIIPPKSVKLEKLKGVNYIDS